MQIYISTSIGKETELKRTFVLSIKNCNKYSADGVSPTTLYISYSVFKFASNCPVPTITKNKITGKS